MRCRCGHTCWVATPVLVRFSKKQVEAIDRLVAEGVGEPRPEVVYRAVESLDEAICQVRTKLEIDQTNREQPQLDPDELSAKAVEIALTRPERWVWTEDGRCIPEQEAEEQSIPIGQCPPRPSLDRSKANGRIRLKFSKEQYEAIDRLVAEEVGVTRPEAIRRAVERLAHVVRRSRGNEEFAESYRQQPDEELEAWIWTADGRFLPEPVVIEQGIPIGTGPPRHQLTLE